jgi:hypothetical protein
MTEKWIAGAVKRPGALSRKAKKAGMSPQAYARAHRHDKGRTGAQARLALVFSQMAKKRRR